MSHGVPVIGARIGAVCDLIEEDVDGLLFEPGNAEELAQKMRMLWHDLQRTATLGRAARARAERSWSAATNLAATLAVYERVLRQEPRRA